MRFETVGIGMLFLGSPALAAPTYLKCDLVQETRTMTIEVTLDEANQEATVFIPLTGNRVRRPAQFYSDKVVVPDGQMMSYEFNRIDGSVIRRMPILDNKVADQGTCKVAEPPAKRAF